MWELVTKKLDLLMSMIMTLCVRHKIFHVLHKMMMKTQGVASFINVDTSNTRVILTWDLRYKLVRMDQN
jgi:hypothetical protein